MISDLSIGKLQPDPDGLDFESLRKEAIRLAQALSGEIWSDFNLHDPGVTILEHLCYGLTDAAYRCQFPVADYLAADDGRIDFEKLALYKPDAVFPSAPLTDLDYRKLLLAKLPNLENVWIERQAERFGSLYRIYLLLGEQVKNQHSAAVEKVYAGKAADIYVAHRNLCEDLESVRLVERQPYALKGDIEVEGQRDPAKVLAAIYAACAQYLCPPVARSAYQDLYDAGQGLDALFTGYAPGQGHIADDDLHAWRGEFSIAELLGRIVNIEGVEHINSLAFVHPDGSEAQIIKIDETQRYAVAACLGFPQNAAEIRLRLHRGGRYHSIAHPDLAKEYERLNDPQRSLQFRKQGIDWLDEILPSGKHRALHDYYSVQNHFPAAYGLNAHGVPDSAGPQRKAQALQLKAYLLLSEQVMANFLQTVEQIQALYSISESVDRTYFHQVLGGDSIPDVERIYQGGIAAMDAAMGQQMAELDAFSDRRSRVLDYLLALHGEKFTQSSLRHFYPAGQAPDQQVIRNKLAYLKELVSLNRDRAGALNYRGTESDDSDPGHTGFKKKIARLLDIDLATVDFKIVEHLLLRPDPEAPGAPASEIPDDFYYFRLSIVFPAALGNRGESEDQRDGQRFSQLVEETVHMNCPAHLHPTVLWLDEAEMDHFEPLHARWREALRTRKAEGAAPELAAFLYTAGVR